MHQESSEECLPDETTIRAVVHSFYAKVREDELLAPVFEPRMAGHWNEHLETMVDFWSSVLLTTGRYQGRPLAVHGQLGEITPEMWARWLTLFTETSHQHASEFAAGLFTQRAQQIAAHLSRSLAMGRPTSSQET